MHTHVFTFFRCGHATDAASLSPSRCRSPRPERERQNSAMYQPPLSKVHWQTHRPSNRPTKVHRESPTFHTRAALYNPHA